MTSLAALASLFALCAGASLLASVRFVLRLERVGARLSLSEAVLGLLAALGADMPEITSSVTALVHRQRGIAVGVVLGSNLFNLATLLGLGALVAGWIALHRRVVVLSGIASLVVVGLAVGLVHRVIGPLATVLVLFGLLIPYSAVLESPALVVRLLRLPPGLASWVQGAVREDEMELEAVVAPARGHAADALAALAYLAAVVAASATMERIGSELGDRAGWSPFVVGGVVLAIVTSLPNAVAGIYLARKGRGAAALSTAMHSNILNVAFGLAIPALIVGVAAGDGGTEITWWYCGATLFALALAYARRGLDRFAGAALVAVYAAFLWAMIRP